MKFCDRLRELRTNAGFTQKELADKLKISAGAIGLYEQGRRKPDDETLISLSMIFNVSVDYLLGLEDKKVLYTSLSDNSPQTKKDELKHLIDSTNIPDEKIDILINMIKSWK